jgi:hypothetical protein
MDLDSFVIGISGACSVVCMTLCAGLVLRRRAPAPSLSPQRLATYNVFVDVWASAIRARRIERAPNEESDERRALHRLMTLYASPETFAAHAALEREFASLDEKIAISAFLHACSLIRREVGSESTLRERDIQFLLFGADGVVGDEWGASSAA